MATQLVPADGIKQLGTILTVWAHPDDETFNAAGILTQAVANGQRVVCVTATKGEAGVQDENRWPAAQLGPIRVAELDQALAIIGIKEHHWLGYADGKCDKADTKEAVTKLERLIKAVNPDTILTFGPEGLTGHPDHVTVSGWVDKAIVQAAKPVQVFHAAVTLEQYDKKFKELDDRFNIFFNIDNPMLRPQAICDICYILPEDLIRKKFQAMAAMPSQMEGMLKYLGETGFEQVFGCEAFVRAH